MTLKNAKIDLTSLSKEQLVSFIIRLEISDMMLDFALNQHIDAAGNHLQFEDYHHMSELYADSMLHRDIVIMGGAQIGKSVWLLITTLAMAANGMNVFYLLPTTGFRDSYVQEKVQRPVTTSQAYQKYIKDSVANKVSQMQFGRGMIKFAGGNSNADMTSFSADVLIYDETDKVETLSNLDLAMSRIDDSIHKLRRFVSNPTDHKGFINLWYEKSDKRVYKCPCDKCGKHSELDWFKTVVKQIKDEDDNVVNQVLRDTEWSPGSPRDIYIKCPEQGCNGNLVRDLKQIDDPANYPRWEPTAYSEYGIVGYHMPSIISSKRSIRDMWYKYKDALESPSKMANFYSMSLALPYMDSGHKISQGVLQRCVQEGYRFELFPDCAYSSFKWSTPTVMGIDTAKFHFDVIISSKEGNRERIVYVGKHNPMDGIGFLHDLVKRYNVEYAIIDAVPETYSAKMFQDEAKCEVWRVNYLNSKDAAETRVLADEGLLELNRTESLDKSYAKFRLGEIILPENYTEILDGSFVSEMTSLTRTQIETRKGFRNIWDGPPESDHARHSDNYRSAMVDFTTSNEISADDAFYVG